MTHLAVYHVVFVAPLSVGVTGSLRSDKSLSIEQETAVSVGFSSIRMRATAGVTPGPAKPKIQTGLGVAFTCVVSLLDLSSRTKHQGALCETCVAEAKGGGVCLQSSAPPPSRLPLAEGRGGALLCRLGFCSFEGERGRK